MRKSPILHYDADCDQWYQKGFKDNSAFYWLCNRGLDYIHLKVAPKAIKIVVYPNYKPGTVMIADIKYSRSGTSYGVVITRGTIIERFNQSRGHLLFNPLAKFLSEAMREYRQDFLYITVEPQKDSQS